MPGVLRLEASDLIDATRWRWALRSSEGTLLAEHVAGGLLVVAGAVLFFIAAGGL